MFSTTTYFVYISYTKRIHYSLGREEQKLKKRPTPPKKRTKPQNKKGKKGNDAQERNKKDHG